MRQRAQPINPVRSHMAEFGTVARLRVAGNASSFRIAAIPVQSAER
jgi:hypothetical protein